MTPTSPSTRSFGAAGGVGKRRDQLLAQRQAIDEALAELDDITAQTEAALEDPCPARSACRQRVKSKETER